MAQTEDFVNRTSEQIRGDIDRSRAEMDETFNALESKLTPGQILGEAWHLLKGGSSAGAGKLFRIAREHPMPAAVIGLGVGWLLVESSRHSEDHGDYGYGQTSYAGGTHADSEGRLAAVKSKVKDAASSAKDAVSDAADRVGETAAHLKDQTLDLGHQAQEKAGRLRSKAKTQVRRARTGFWQTMEANPLMMGAATLALGVVAGLAIPSTRREDELLGETRDHLLEQAKEKGKEALDMGRQVAEKVAGTVKSEAESQGLTAAGLADKVKTVAREATNTAKEEVKKQTSTEAGSQQPVEEPELARF